MMNNLFKTILLSENRGYKRIYFLKTHKTASSTLQSIFFRYVNKHRMLLALPANSGHMFNYPFAFKKDTVLPIKIEDKSYDGIILHHVRRRDEINKILGYPNSNIIRVTTVRNPIDQFISSFYYYRLDSNFQPNLSDDENLMDILKSFKARSGVKSRATLSSVRRNHQLFDMGYGSIHDHSHFLKKIVNEIEKYFDLIIISEYFDVSLVLLKHLMDCSYEDLVYGIKLKNSKPKPWPSKHLELAKFLNREDTFAYVQFNKTFWNKVDEFGKERMKIELEKLKETREHQLRRCIKKDKWEQVEEYIFKNNLTSITNYFGEKHLNETIDFSTFHCSSFITGEIETVTYLKKQYKMMQTKYKKDNTLTWNQLFDDHQTIFKLIPTTFSSIRIHDRKPSK
ncbi:hypothetical protein SNEBB_010493 [Seison nebaliae]|nr:hypothetical protein SNEBB_010493 [Seison nebaliae]